MFLPYLDQNYTKIIQELDSNSRRKYIKRDWVKAGAGTLLPVYSQFLYQEVF